MKKTFLRIGNLSRSRKKGSDDWYLWRMFVRSKDDVIDSVVFKSLHTMKVMKVVDSPPFEHASHAWGRFGIEMAVRFLDGQEKKFQHMLEFCIPNGKWCYSKIAEYEVKVRQIDDRYTPCSQVDDITCQPLEKELEDYEKLKSSMKESDYYYDLGRYYYFVLKDYKSAVECFENCLKFEKSHFQSCYHLGGVHLYGLKDFKTADRFLNYSLYLINAKEKHGLKSVSTYHYNRGNFNLLHHLDYDEAVKEFSKGIHKLPFLGHEEEEEEKKTAEEKYQEETLLRCFLHFNRGLCYKEQWEFFKAFEDFSEVTRLLTRRCDLFKNKDTVSFTKTKDLLLNDCENLRNEVISLLDKKLENLIEKRRFMVVHNLYLNNSQLFTLSQLRDIFFFFLHNLHLSGRDREYLTSIEEKYTQQPQQQQDEQEDDEDEEIEGEEEDEESVMVPTPPPPPPAPPSDNSFLSGVEGKDKKISRRVNFKLFHQIRKEMNLHFNHFITKGNCSGFFTNKTKQKKYYENLKNQLLARKEEEQRTATTTTKKKKKKKNKKKREESDVDDITPFWISVCNDFLVRSLYNVFEISTRTNFTIEDVDEYLKSDDFFEDLDFFQYFICKEKDDNNNEDEAGGDKKKKKKKKGKKKGEGEQGEKYQYVYIGEFEICRDTKWIVPNGQGILLISSIHNNNLKKKKKKIKKIKDSLLLKGLMKKKKKKNKKKMKNYENIESLILHVRYSGSFKDGVKDGIGSLFVEESNLMEYEGLFQENKKSGKGIENTYSSSSKEQMIQSSEEQEGEEALSAADSFDALEESYFEERYEGQFMNGTRHGMGELYDSTTGRFVRGIWKNGEFDESSVYNSYQCPILSYFDLVPYLSRNQIVGSGAYGTIWKIKSASVQKVMEKKQKNQKKKDFSLDHQFYRHEYFAIKLFNSANIFQRNILYKNIKRAVELCYRVKNQQYHYRHHTTTTTTKTTYLKNQERTRSLSFSGDSKRSYRSGSGGSGGRGDVSHILEILAIVEGPSQVGYIMPLCKVSVDKIIIASKGTLSMEEKTRILLETAKGMASLHANNIMHRDLKWANVLMGFDDVIKITDFDTLREDERDWKYNVTQLTSRVGTPGFIAPEVFIGKKKKYGLKCDVFSFGLMIYSLLFEKNNPYMTQYSCLCGTLCEHMLISSSLSLHVAQCNFRPLLDPREMSDIPRFIIDIMVHSWDKDELQRPSFSEIVKIFENEKKRTRCYTIITLIFQQGFEEEERKKEDEEKSGEEDEMYDIPFFDEDEDSSIIFQEDKKKKEEKKKKEVVKYKPFIEKMLLVEPKLEKIYTWIEHKFGLTELTITSKLKLEHPILGEVRTDEDVFRLISMETRPRMTITATNFKDILKRRRKNNDMYNLFSTSSSSKTSQKKKKNERLYKENERLARKNKELEDALKKAEKKVEEYEYILRHMGMEDL